MTNTDSLMSRTMLKLAPIPPLLLVAGAIPMAIAGLAGGPKTGIVATLPWMLAIIVSGVLTALLAPYDALRLLLFLIVFQEISLMIASHFLTASAITVLTLSKDVFSLALLAILLARYRLRFTPLDLIALSFIALLLFSFVLSYGRVPLFTLGTILKQSAMPFLLYFVGRLLPLSPDHQAKGIRLLVRMGIFVAVFGLVERFLLGDRFWIQMGIHELAKAEGVYDLYPFERFGSDFASPLFYFLGDPSSRRLASISGQPQATAYFLALPFVILCFAPSLYSSDRFKVVGVQLLLGIALALTIGRGGILIAVMGLVLSILKRSTGQFATIILILGGMFLASGGLQYIFSLGHGGGRHLVGLKKALVILQGAPFGYGLGTGGNYAAQLGLTTQSGAGWESYIGALGFQLGIVGLSLFTCFFVLAFYGLFLKNRSYMPSVFNKLNQAIGVAVLGLFIASFFAEAALGILSSGFYLLLLGMVVRNSVRMTRAMRSG